MPSWIYRFPSCSFSCFFAAALHVVFAATCTLCSPRRRHGSALRRGVRDGVATVRETSRRSRRGVGGDGGGRSRRFSGGPALSAGLATRLSTRAIVPAVKIQKKRPLGPRAETGGKNGGGRLLCPWGVELGPIQRLFFCRPGFPWFVRLSQRPRSITNPVPIQFQIQIPIHYHPTTIPLPSPPCPFLAPPGYVRSTYPGEGAKTDREGMVVGW